MTKRRERVQDCIDCGATFITLSNKALRCKPCAKSSDYRQNMLDYKWRLKKLTAMAKNRATTKNLPYDIDHEFIVKLWEDNEGCCVLTGFEFDLEGWGKKGQVNPQAPSLDRVIPALGYVKGNVRLITYHTNIALSDFGIEEFEKLAEAIIGVAR